MAETGKAAPASRLVPKRAASPETPVKARLDEGAAAADARGAPAGKHADAERELGGRDGPDPTRFGDWEKNGRCIDF